MEERIVAVMGATGSGKSSLIKLATGDSDSRVGHGLKSGKIHIQQDFTSIQRVLTVRLRIQKLSTSQPTPLSSLESKSRWSIHQASTIHIAQTETS
jgi:ABC-type Mn2+/Zn2+ transport system ATPase subunit